MRYKVIFRRQAEDEAIAVADYIAEHASEEAGLRWYEGLEAAILSLESMPARCSYAREHGAFPGIEIRQLLYRSHRVIFTVHPDEVHVLHIRHVAQANIELAPSDL